MGSLMVLACAANLLVLSNSLFISFFAWSAISLLLFRTMSLRGEAKNSARTVFRHHLASDLCLLVAFVLLYKLSGSTELSKLQPNMSSTASAHLLKTIAVCLIVISMSIKSALYPFHRWLLATLDAPTPLSGLLHAGIVNVAAILAARLFPVLQDSTPVLFTWGLLSALSATLGTLSMSAQFDVKRKLVYSTVGQMGFMCLQCALGAIPAAIFHLIAHGLFKCHMFLQSGAGVAEGLVKRRYGTNKTSSTDHKWLIAFVMILVSALSLTYNSALSSLTGQTVFSASIAMLAIVFSLPSIRRTGALLFTLTSLILMSMIGISLSTAHCLEKSIVQFGGAPNLKVMGSCVLLFALLNLGLELKAKSNIGKALYVHALNGFYVAQLKHELKPKTKSPQSA